MRDFSDTPETRLPRPQLLATRHLPLATVLNVLVAVLLPCCFVPSTLAQTETATIAGRVSDPSGAVVPDAVLHLVNIDKGTDADTKTNGSGLYTFPAVQPGRYRIEVQRDGFKITNITGLVVNVQDNLEENFRLEVGSTSESVTVDGSGVNINTTDASVSTVVDRQFVDTMPLNGRSFQSLILLAPGVVTNSPQSSVLPGYNGEFSVNGQRADSNNFTVDGVSANISPSQYGYSSAGSAGGLQATTALGTTQALVSVDALQEFKIQTSTYSAEYGRQPGAQISFETRSGTNSWHGSAFDYLRNDAFDANNWFNDYATPVVRKPAERQNDFGGTVGGPVGIPKLYSGKDRTFAFFSYEGLRLTQPQPASVLYVPSNGTNNTATYANPQDENLRANSPTAIQPALDAFPLPNCTTAIDSMCIDPGNGLSPYLLSTSLPSGLNAISLRFDEHVAPWLRLFFRYGAANSSAHTVATTIQEFTTTDITTLTTGGDMFFGKATTNQIRLNYSPARRSFVFSEPSYGGSVPYNIQTANGLAPNAGVIFMELIFPGYLSYYANGADSSRQHQSNIVDTLERKQSNHTLHLGVDYRRTSSRTNVASPEMSYSFTSAQGVRANSTNANVTVSIPQHPEFTNFSVFVQDEWRASRVVSLSLGLRWEINPPPSVTSGVGDRTIDGDFDNPSSLSLAPAGTPLYRTTYHNLAPRLGIASLLRSTAGHELVFRAGAGVFYDTGQNLGILFGEGYSPGTGFSVSYPPSAGTSYPISPTLYDMSPSPTPPYSLMYVASQHLQLPYSFQWNTTLEQALGARQSLSLGYVGSNGRRLIQQSFHHLTTVNPLFTNVYEYQNGLSASYNALQAQYRRTLSHGLQALASYTWGHSLDYESQDVGIFTYQRGNSDFDVRNNVSAALSYDVPKRFSSTSINGLLGGWGADLRFTARSGFPVTFEGNEILDPATGNEVYSGLNLLPSVSLYQFGAQYPGGRRINPAAFALPSGTQVGNAPRNFVRGFGEDELNLAIRRELSIYEGLHLQFRADAFNALNHPNFGYINPNYGNALFGEATSTLASSLGGLSPIYQQGGQRSMQLSLRLQF